VLCVCVNCRWCFGNRHTYSCAFLRKRHVSPSNRLLILVLSRKDNKQNANQRTTDEQTLGWSINQITGNNSSMHLVLSSLSPIKTIFKCEIIFRFVSFYFFEPGTRSFFGVDTRPRLLMSTLQNKKESICQHHSRYRKKKKNHPTRTNEPS
jgi:hypothetical protein